MTNSKKLLQVAEAIMDSATEEYREDNLASIESVQAYAENGMEISLTDAEAQKILLVCRNFILLGDEANYRADFEDRFIDEDFDDLDADEIAQEWLKKLMAEELARIADGFTDEEIINGCAFEATIEFNGKTYKATTDYTDHELEAGASEEQIVELIDRLIAEAIENIEQINAFTAEEIAAELKEKL